MGFSKLFLCVTNVILFTVAIVVIGIASVSIYRANKYGELLLLQGQLPLPALILVVGIFTTILVFLGIDAAWEDSKYMLYTYAGIMLVCFLTEVVLALYVLIHPSVTQGAFESFMDIELQKYDESKPDEAWTMEIDGMQEYDQCCGVNGPQYWTNLGKEIPDSCLCQTEDKNCKRSSDNSYYYQQGCAVAILKDRKSIRIALGVAVLIMAFVTFLSMISAFIPANRTHYKLSNL